jgi:hypothetical protein
VPTGSIEDQHDVLVVLDRLGELVEVDLHGVRRDFGQHEREGIVGTGLDGAVDVGERVALIALARRALAARVPAMADAALLADARLVLKEETYALFSSTAD